jgi:parallel beta helix pectate lyase-like protein
MSTLLRVSAFFVSLLLALPAFAAARTFVASTGVDTNPCSLVAPCRGFAAAVAVTDANGEVLVLDSAGYGILTINKSVSIIAPDGIYAGVSVPVGQNGIVVNGAGIKVVLRGLTINGQGGIDGIAIQNAGDVFIERTTIANTGAGTGDVGIRVAATAAAARVFVTDTTVRGSHGAGILIQANATVLVDRCRIEGNGGDGVAGMSAGGKLTVTDSLVARNVVHGIRVEASAAGNWDVTVARGTIEGNGINGVVIGPGTNGIYRAAVTGNMVRGNGNDGIFVFGSSGETATALAGNNQSVANASVGIHCDGLAGSNATLVAERNEVLGSVSGLTQSGICTFKSMGDNTVENNTTQLTGVITPATLR